MPCRIYLRRDQSLHLQPQYSSADITIFAPLWVKAALKIVGDHLRGVTFELFDSSTSGTVVEPTPSITITEDFNGHSLKVLEQIARNEACNTSGVINKSLYPDISDQRVLYSLRDLVRHCVIAGEDEAISCGGYRCVKEAQRRQRVYICDLAALQFQQPYNSGRLVLIGEEQRYEGIVDDVIYENIVGEKKGDFRTVFNGWTNQDPEIRQRYLPHDGYGMPGNKSYFIDTFAYRKFVANDVVLSGLALSKVASRHNDKINFKFLKYGTGFFAWRFAVELERLILSGVVDGLERLFGRQDEVVLNTIKCVELPFYKCDPKSEKRIDALKRQYKIRVVFNENDALKQTEGNLVTATTNCGDNHAACGNEMGYGSVDAAIAENLASRGHHFCPNINVLMTEEFIDTRDPP